MDFSDYAEQRADKDGNRPNHSGLLAWFQDRHLVDITFSHEKNSEFQSFNRLRTWHIANWAVHIKIGIKDGLQPGDAFLFSATLFRTAPCFLCNVFK